MEGVRWLDSSGMRYGNNKGMGSLGIRYGKEMSAFVKGLGSSRMIYVNNKEG
jgi:hypothetical protein